MTCLCGSMKQVQMPEITYMRLAREEMADGEHVADIRAARDALDVDVHGT